MTILRFNGVVTFGDGYRCSDEQNGYVFIDGKDIIAEVEQAWPMKGKVTAAIADARYEGELAYETGWGYSDWTPMDSDLLEVGPHNLLKIIAQYEDQPVTLWIADEPFNTLEGVHISSTLGGALGVS